MKLIAFRIKNFRSISDSKWIPFSQDGITTIVGMNESGKTSLLEALSCTLGNASIDERDVRFDCPTPEVFLEFQLDQDEINELLSDSSELVKSVVANHFRHNDNRYKARFYWELKGTKYEGYMDHQLEEIVDKLNSITASTTSNSLSNADSASDNATEPLNQEQAIAESDPVKPDFYTLLVNKLEILEPVIVFFSDDSGVLPDTIDVVDQTLKGSGTVGARNFLTVAGIDLQKLVQGSDIERVNLLKRATKKITQDFAEFWSQHIGEAKQLELECEILAKREGTGAGQPYLTFWITDGVNRLHPSQRSKGLRWYLSFYLQLRASEVRNRKIIFLLDEPGANLHETAQLDVLKLINKISPSLVGLIYTTHSPYLIEPDRPHRILTVERAGDSDESPSIIRSVLKDASSLSAETLSPIYTRMGVDFWRQTVIERTNNVLLEEPSALYYMRAFWRLSDAKKRACFIPATGVNNLPQLAYMFVGWGLAFTVLVDDEPSGRGVFNELKKTLCVEADQPGPHRLLKIKECDGIEDIFSSPDFKKFVLKENFKPYTGNNSAYVKRSNDSKPLLACRFLLAVEQGSISLNDLDSDTRTKISSLVSLVEATLQ